LVDDVAPSDLAKLSSRSKWRLTWSIHLLQISPWNSLSHYRIFTALLSRLQAITSSRKSSLSRHWSTMIAVSNDSF
jgi:hypothetical protein